MSYVQFKVRSPGYEEKVLRKVQLKLVGSTYQLYLQSSDQKQRNAAQEVQTEGQTEAYLIVELCIGQIIKQT